MNFKEIKTKLINQLKGYTIDDYYMNPALVLQMFIEIPHIKETVIAKIKNNSEDYKDDDTLPDASKLNYPDYVYEILEEKLNDSMPVLKIESLKSNYDIIIEKINNLFNEFDAQIESSNKSTIIPEDDFTTKENQLISYRDELNSCNSKIKSLVDEYNLEINQLIIDYSDLVRFVLAVKPSARANAIYSDPEKQHHREGGQIIGQIGPNVKSITSIYLNEKSTRPTYYKWSEERRFSHTDLNIERLSSFSDYSSEDYESIIKPYVNEENIIPRNWRDILINLFNNPIKDISQPVDINPYYQNSDSNFSNVFKLKNCDISTILATRIAVESNSFIISENNTIVLKVSGGIMAKILFREKGCFMQNEEFKIVRKKYINNMGNYVSLYNIDGYTSSSIKIEVPFPYLFIFDKYVIQIEYLSAPILFESNTASKITHDFSSSDKLRDESFDHHKKIEEEKKEEEEERKRREEEYEEEKRKKYDD